MGRLTGRRKLQTLGLFAGVGGIELGLERTGGFRAAAFCESDPYCRAVLRRHWPRVPIYEDVRELRVEEGAYDVITGGFPCQPVSLAGRRQAQKDERWLWPEFARIVGEARPSYVLVENVRGLCSKGLPEVVADLAGLGYDAEWQIVSAAAVGAPHLRERVFLVAYPDGAGRRSAGLWPRVYPASPKAWEDGLAPRARELRGAWAIEPDMGRVANGVPARLDRLRALGNAVVPQCAELVGGLILEDWKRGKAPSWEV